MIEMKDIKQTEQKKKTERKASNSSKVTDKKIQETQDTKIIEDLKLKLKDVEDKLLRELAENDNLRKRHEKELSDSHKFSIKNFSLDILTVSDNFQRAIYSIPKDDLEASSILKNLVVGLESVEKEMHVVFERNGVKPFESMGDTFNPELHQAVSYKNSDKKSGVIIEEMQKGYKIAERLLRPAMVTVSKGPEGKKENSSE
ncbi:MAG: nucleotide exchange factor GrpE [Rickettsiales bacterium]|nr:nucleotide exchange factor GrpE [Rickettsiales bacterium]OUT45101.1 MAG: nucleotide exchange factor GrpE [Pelagibacteraceae bacterium TMED13]